MRRALRWATSMIAFGAILGATSDAHALGLCAFSTVTGVSFPGYNVFSTTPTDSVGSVQFACAVGTSVTATLNVGSGTSYATRAMKSGASTLFYNLFLDAGHTIIWGDGTNGTQFYGPVTLEVLTTQTIYVYGRIPALQNVPIGTYNDSITVTINF